MAAVHTRIEEANRGHVAAWPGDPFGQIIHERVRHLLEFIREYRRRIARSPDLGNASR